MTPQEELDLANLRYREIADELNRIRSQRQDIYNTAKDFINASPEKQAEASADMKRLLDMYSTLWTLEKNVASEIVWATERIAAAESAVRNAQESKPQPSVKRRETPKTSLPKWYTEEFIEKYGLIWPEEDVVYTDSNWVVYVPWAPENPVSLTIPVKYSNELPTRKPELTQDHIDQLVAINNMQPWTPQWTLTEWPKTTFWDYAKWAWNGFTDTFLNPQELTYWSSSRQPWYNIWANIWRLWTLASFARGARWFSPSGTSVPTAWTIPGRTITRAPTSLWSYAPAYRNITNTTAKFMNWRTLPENANKLFWDYANSSVWQNAPVLQTVERFLK